MENYQEKDSERNEGQVVESTGHHSSSQEMSILEKISFWIVTALVFLLPVSVYLPFSGFPLDFSKKVVLFGGVILALIFWLLARFEDGKFTFPGGLILKSWIILFSAFFLSSVALFWQGRSISQSVFGLGLDTDTSVTITVLIILMFLSSSFFQSIKRLSYFYTALLASFLFVFIVEVIHLYTGGNFITDAGMVSNLIGKWNDLGIFFGLGIVLSLSAIELLEIGYYSKITIWSVLVGSIAMSAIVNYGPIWIVTGICSLLILVYSIFFNGMFAPGEKYSKRKIISRPSFAIILVCLALFFLQGKTGEMLQKYNITNIDVRPSFSATIDIAQSTIKEDTRSLFFGSGPNSFSDQWLKFKPEVVNSSIFWNLDFNSGIGRVPSYAITLGLIGILAWAFFIGLIAYYGFKTILYSNIQRSSKFIVFISFIGVGYLWTFSIIYIPDTVLFALSFLLTGVFIASLTKTGILKDNEFSFLNDPRLGFASVLVLVLLVITSISGGYLIGKKFTANYLFQKGMFVLNYSGDTDAALENIRLAAEYDEQDLYFRTLSEINILKLRNFVSTQKIADKDSLAILQEIIVSASANARKSIDLNQFNYLNWMSLGRVGEAVVPLKVVEGSYSLSSDSYKKALLLNPKNPAILLNMARLEIANNDINKAKEYLGESLKLKNNFTPALYLLSQIEASQGNLKDAIKSAEQAYLFAPNDLGILFQLGFLKFSDKDYRGAVVALERAVSINSQYSNAKYFLGLSYAKLGENGKAISQFKEIGVLNPDNAEVKSIISNLTRGRDPFAPAVQAPVESTPQKDAQ